MASVDDRWTKEGPDGTAVRTARWGKGKRWRARWREYPGGPQKTKHFTRKVDAESHLVEVQHKLLSGTYTSTTAGRITVAQYADEWVSRRTWREATAERIERELRLYIVPGLGSWPLANLRRPHIERWAKGMKQVQDPNKDLAASSVARVVETLATLLAAAVEDERIPRNPASGVQLASVDKPPIVALDVDQVRSLAHAAAEHVRAGVVLVAATGLRQGELFGLALDRVNFLRRELRVDQQLWTPQKGSPVLRPPKTRRGFRTITLSAVAVEALSAQVATFGTGEHGLIFHNDGRPIVRAMASKYARKAGASAGVEDFGWHDLRHHHASSLLSRGVNPAKVAERLGHDIKTLLATYAHCIKDDDDRVRTIVDETLGERAEDWLRTEAV